MNKRLRTHRSAPAKPTAPESNLQAAAPGVVRPVGKRRAPPAAAGTSSTAQPGARISRRAADRLRAGHLWVYASDIESLNAEEGNPPLLAVADQRGLLLGTALYSPSSQIALRMISREAIDEHQWLRLLADRLRAAITRRKPMLSAETDSCRLVFSEADQLPGLVADKYGDLVILQLLARGLDSSKVREVCADVIREELAPGTILERPDPRIRELEGLSAPDLAPIWSRDPAIPATR